MQNALLPGGLLALPVATAAAAADFSSIDANLKRRRRPNSGRWIAIASFLFLGLLKILRFYAGLFFLLPLCRLLIVLTRNAGVERRNRRRKNFIRTEL